MADMLEDGAVGINRDHPVYNGGSNPHVVQGGIAGFVGDPGGNATGVESSSTKPQPKAPKSDPSGNGSVLAPNVPQSGVSYRRIPYSVKRPFGGYAKSQVIENTSGGFTAGSPDIVAPVGGQSGQSVGELQDSVKSIDQTRTPTGPGPIVHVPANFIPADPITNPQQFKSPDPYHDPKYVGPPTNLVTPDPNK